MNTFPAHMRFSGDSGNANDNNPKQEAA